MRFFIRLDRSRVINLIDPMSD